MNQCCAYKCTNEPTKRYYLNEYNEIYEEFCEEHYKEYEPEKYEILMDINDLVQPNLYVNQSNQA